MEVAGCESIRCHIAQEKSLSRMEARQPDGACFGGTGMSKVIPSSIEEQRIASKKITRNAALTGGYRSRLGLRRGTNFDGAGDHQKHYRPGLGRPGEGDAPARTSNFPGSAHNCNCSSGSSRCGRWYFGSTFEPDAA